MSAFYDTSIHFAMCISRNTTAPSLVAIDAYMSSLVHSNSHGHFVRIRQQMIASLCLDLISELEKNELLILNQPFLQQARGVLRVAIQRFESRTWSTNLSCSPHLWPISTRSR